MKTVILVLLFAAYVSTSPVNYSIDFEAILAKEKEVLPRYIEFTNEDGSVETIDLEAPVNYDIVESAEKNTGSNEFWLFTRANPYAAQKLQFEDIYSVINSNFDPRRKTVFLVHGWNNNANSEPNPSSRAALLNTEDVNIISFDWREGANANYVTAVASVPGAGRELGQFIKWLTIFGLPLSNIHLVGFSLGAHVVGNAGRECGGKIARITGLDPAGPLWYYNPSSISSTDAVYVEAIHTDGGNTYASLGIGKAVAQVDFFPNGGISMPGCSNNSCNHGRAPLYFASTVSYNHLIGRKCASQLQLRLDLCFGDTLHMGNNQLSKNASNGIYRLNTLAVYPY